MVRRVGFGDDEPEKSRKSVADRALDEHRAKARQKANAPKPSNRRSKRIIAPILFLTIWIGVFIAIILNMTSEGLGTNIPGLVIFTAISALVISRVIKGIIKTARGTNDPTNRPENF